MRWLREKKNPFNQNKYLDITLFYSSLLKIIFYFFSKLLAALANPKESSSSSSSWFPSTHLPRISKLGSFLKTTFRSLHKPPNHDHHQDANHDHETIIKLPDSLNNLPPTSPPSQPSDQLSFNDSDENGSCNLSSLKHKVKSKIIKPTIEKLSSRISPKKHRSSNPGQTTPPNISPTIAPPDVPSHPIAQVFREEQLGRNVFLLAMPTATGFMLFYNPTGTVPLPGHLAVGALCVGSTAVWTGILMRKVWPRASGALELLGAALMLVPVFGFLGSRLPEGYLWLPALCLVVCLVPLGVALWSCRDTNADDNGDRVPADMADQVWFQFPWVRIDTL